MVITYNTIARHKQEIVHDAILNIKQYEAKCYKFSVYKGYGDDTITCQYERDMLTCFYIYFCSERCIILVHEIITI